MRRFAFFRKGEASAYGEKEERNTAGRTLRE
jgi:hypothetical protein